MLDIPAALHADARIEAECADTREPVVVEVRSGRVSADDVLVHFAVPFQFW